MKDQDLIKLVQVSDLPEACQDLAQVMGLGVVIDLIDYSGGGSLYFPSKGSVVRHARNRVIREKFDGGNYKELSTEFGISGVQIRSIVH